MASSQARALITVDGARRKGATAAVKDALESAIADLETVFVVRHTSVPCAMRPGRDVWMHEAMAAAAPECPAEPLDAEHPLFILYSSGSTAKPKASCTPRAAT
jgi:acetyl-CoA synthetase